jgi:hypothetical protein
MGSRIESSIYLGVEDVRGEGVAEVLDRIVGDYALTGLTVAAAYHRARDLTPHGSPRVTVRHDGVHFVPDADLFEGLRLQPPVQSRASEQPIRALRRHAHDRGIAAHGWTVFLHNTTIGASQPECTTENAYGDYGSPADLCPSNLDVQAYAVALARNVARLGVDTVVAESLHFGAFDHGYHHQRSSVRLGALDQFLLGLCFCPSCGGFARQHGIDVDAARAGCLRALAVVLDGGQPSASAVTPESLAEAAGQELSDFATARVQIVAGLVGRVATAVEDEGSKLCILDVTGAMKGYADGMPGGRAAADDAWQLGVDPVSVGSLVPEYAALAYARDSARAAMEVASYRTALGARPKLRAVLRPCSPDCESTENLTQKVVSVRATGADAVDFYHYGLAPFAALERIPVALA